MAHIRKRHIEKHIEKLLSFSPIVGVLGHRQVGKTTTLEDIAASYVTMDTKSEAESAASDPDGFADRFSSFPCGIDECQLAPALFPALKDRVRRVKRPGQFLLTGSVRFTSRKAIQESLTGRIINVEMHPLMVSELIETSEPRVASFLLDSSHVDLDKLASRFKITAQQITRASKTLLATQTSGSLPGVCFVRDSAIRAQKFESQIETILTRDLRLLIETTLSLESLRRVLSMLALQQGQPLELADLSRKTRISIPALRRLIDAFEALFLIWRVPCVGGEKRPSLYLEDCGEAYHLTDSRIDQSTMWVSVVATQLRSIFDIPLSGADGAIARLSQFRTRGGVYVPLVVSRKDRHLGVIPILEARPTPAELGSARSLLKALPKSRVVFVTMGGGSRLISANMLSIPGGLMML